MDLAQIVENIRDNTNRESNQHVMIIGQRGSGKTTLALRVALAIRQDPELAQKWYPLRYPEESYEVLSPGEFWLEALFHLARQTGDERWRRTYDDLRLERDEDRLRNRALGQLLDFAESQDKKLLLIVENMNMLFNDQISEDDAWKLRHDLMHEPRLMLLGTATQRFKGIDDYGKAFFEMFRLHELDPLDEEECNTVWERIAGEKLAGRKIRSIQILTGGNLRLLTIIAKFGQQHSFHRLLDELVNLVDEHTEYFKSHLDNLAPVERKVYLALAGLWDPSLTRDIASAARRDVNKTSALLKRLCERGAVTAIPDTPGGRNFRYMLSERMYNIYYLLRRSGTSGRVRAVINFMAELYGKEIAFLSPFMGKSTLSAEDEQAIYEEIPVRFSASETAGSILRDLYKHDIEPLRASVNLIYAHGDAGNLVEMRAIFEAMRELGDSEEVRLERAKASINLIYAYGEAGNLAEARAIFDAMREFGDSEEVRLVRAMASINLIYAYGEASDLTEARAIFDAMQEFGDSEEVRLARAKASVNLIVAYGKADDLAEARTIFEAMREFGDSEEVRLERAKASVNLIHDYAKVGDLAEARAIFDIDSNMPCAFLSAISHDSDNTEYLARVTHTFMLLAALGRAGELLRLIECSGSAKYFEPLVVCLRRHLGEKVWVAWEIHEVAKDMAEKIRDIERHLAKTAQPSPNTQSGANQ
ncbi:MAG: hypothetical protein LBL48_12155 [Azoarcus sp.]|nr:hypothetical protein [Azoarcus sp.]